MGGRGSKVIVVRGSHEEYAQIDGEFPAAFVKEFAGSNQKSSGRTACEKEALQKPTKQRRSVERADQDNASEHERSGFGSRSSNKQKDKKAGAEALGLRAEAAKASRAGGVAYQSTAPGSPPVDARRHPKLYASVDTEVGQPAASGTGRTSQQADSRTSGTGYRQTATGTTSKQSSRRNSICGVTAAVHPLPQGMPAAQPDIGTQGRPSPTPPPPQQQQQFGVGPAATADEAANGTAAYTAASEVVQWVIRPTPPIESVYKLGQVLGQGSFGTVRAATHLVSGSEVAVKTIRKSLLRAADVTALRREVEILHHLSGHPHISQLLGVYEERRQLHLVLELYKGGDLFDAIIGNGRHSERTAADVMRTVLKSISYCHAMGVAHRDIKPENFMLTAEQPSPTPAAKGGQPAAQAGGGKGGQNTVSPTLGARLKLIDFGLSTFCTDDTPMTEVVGTSYYVAPEVLDGRYSLSADIWSAGVILHIMLTGYAPFDGKDDKEILRAVRKGKVNLTADAIWKSISREAADVMLAMLERDPKKRATADQVLAMPWLGCTAEACTAPSVPLPGVVSERMRRFARMNSFKKEARRVVAGLMRPEEVAGLVAQFRGLDTDRDGRLSAEELKNGLARMALLSGAGGGLGAAATPLPLPLDERELKQLLRRSDLNGDGMLDESEFLGAVLPAAAITRQALAAAAAAAASRPTSSRRGNAIAAAFAHFDADGSGYITVDELQKALATHHTAGKGPDFAALLSRFDRDADGRISYHEFVEMLVQEADDGDVEDVDGEGDPRQADTSSNNNSPKPAGAAAGHPAGGLPSEHTAGAAAAAGEVSTCGCGALDALATRGDCGAPVASSRRTSIAWSAGAEPSCGNKAAPQGAGGGPGRPSESRVCHRSSTVVVRPPSGLVTPLDWSDECHEDNELGVEAEPLESFTTAALPAAGNAVPLAACRVGVGSRGGAVSSSSSSSNACRLPSRFSAPQQMIPLSPQPPAQPLQPGRPSLRCSSASRYAAAAAAAAVAGLGVETRSSPDADSPPGATASPLRHTHDPVPTDRDLRLAQGTAAASPALTPAAAAAARPAAPAGRPTPPPRLQLPVQPAIVDARGRRHSTTGMVPDTRACASGSPIMVPEPRTPMTARAPAARGTTHPGTPDVGLGFHHNFNDLAVPPRFASPVGGAAVSQPGTPSAAAAAAAAQRILVARGSIGVQRSPHQHPLSPSYTPTNGHSHNAPASQLLPALQPSGSTSPDGESRPTAPPASPFGWSPTSGSPAGSRAGRASTVAGGATATPGPMSPRHSLHHLHPGSTHTSCGGGAMGVAAAAARPATPSAPLPLLPSSVSRSRRQSTGSPAWSTPGAGPAAGPVPSSPNPLSPRVPALIEIGGGGPSSGRRSRRYNAPGTEDILVMNSRDSVDLELASRAAGAAYDEACMSVLPPGATGYGMPSLPYMALAPGAMGKL